MNLFYEAITYDSLTGWDKNDLKDGSSCEICGSFWSLEVDHDHLTGLVRGILCAGCNRILGRIENGLPVNDSFYCRAAEYLECNEDELRNQMHLYADVSWSGHTEITRKYQKNVRAEIDRLQSEAWERREIPGELERINEIVQLAREQLKDDTYLMERERIGRASTGRVLHRSFLDPDYVEP